MGMDCGTYRVSLFSSEKGGGGGGHYGTSSRAVTLSCLREVTNLLRMTEPQKRTLRDLVDGAGLDSSPERPQRAPKSDDVALKLLSIVEGHFDAPGFADRKNFTNAVHRQRLASHRPSGGVIYEAAWDSISPGRLKRVYTRTVPDWDTSTAATFHIRWWSRGMEHYTKWDRGLRFWTFEELQEAHREQLSGTSGPHSADWCRTEGGSMDWGMFWSAALLYKATGSSGVKYWDDQFRAMKSSS